MSRRSTSVFLRLAAATLSLCLGGCTYSIDMRYAPTSTPRPLELERKPRIFVEPAEDRVDGVAKHTAAQTGRFTPLLPESIREALTIELGRLDIPVAKDRQQADAVLRVVVTQAHFTMETISQTWATARLLANLVLQLTVRSPDGRLLWENTIVGTGRGTGKTAWRPALAEAMGKLGPLLDTNDVVARIFKAVPAAPAPRRTAAASLLSDVDALPPRRASRKPRAYAVVIGIREYSQDLPQADFADADARLVSRYLTQVLGFESANVAVLLNDKATKSDFEKHFEGWLPNRVEEEAEVFIYYSGHGAPNPATGQAYLVPYDGDPTYLDKTGYPLERLYAQLGKLRSSKVTIVVDSCFSGAGGRSLLAKGAKPLVALRSSVELPWNVTLLSASAGDQISHSYHEKGHGLFTYFLLKGIKETTGRGDLDWRALFDQAVPQVSTVARREYNADQTPQWRNR